MGTTASYMKTGKVMLSLVVQLLAGQSHRPWPPERSLQPSPVIRCRPPATTA